MGCLVAVIAVFTPRIALLIMWIFTPYVSRAFNGSFIWPFVGFLFLPFTTIFYSLAWTAGRGVTGTAWIWVGLGVVLDLFWHGGGAWRSRREYD